MSLFQSNLRKQIRNLPKILNFVKKIHYYCELFTSLLRQEFTPRSRRAEKLFDRTSRRAAGRLTRSRLLAKEGRTVGCVGCPPNWRTSGNVGEASDFLERRAHGRVPAAFWKSLENCWLNLAKIQQNSGTICDFFFFFFLRKLEKNSKKFSNF